MSFFGVVVNIPIAIVNVSLFCSCCCCWALAETETFYIHNTYSHRYSTSSSSSSSTSSCSSLNEVVVTVTKRYLVDSLAVGLGKMQFGLVVVRLHQSVGENQNFIFFLHFTVICFCTWNITSNCCQ